MLDATYFTYNGVKSENYQLMIADIDADTVRTVAALSPILHTTKPPAINHFFHNGVTYDNPPQHTFAVFSRTEIPVNKSREILSWLAGADEFKELRFRHTSANATVWCHCVFTNIEHIFIDNRCYGFRLTAIFDSPYMTSSLGGVSLGEGLCTNGRTTTVHNSSDIVDKYIYPIVEFTGDSITIVNETDDPGAVRPFVITGCGNNTQGVRVDNELKIITSKDVQQDISLRNFTSKNWLRLRDGDNRLRITCSGSVKIDIPRYYKIGF